MRIVWADGGGEVPQSGVDAAAGRDHTARVVFARGEHICCGDYVFIGAGHQWEGHVGQVASIGEHYCVVTIIDRLPRVACDVMFGFLTRVNKFEMNQQVRVRGRLIYGRICSDILNPTIEGCPAYQIRDEEGTVSCIGAHHLEAV